MQSPARLSVGAHEELLALLVRQAAEVRLRHRGSSVGRFLDATEPGFIRVRSHVAERDLPHHELPERLGGMRIEHPAHECLELGRTWLVALTHAFSDPALLPANLPASGKTVPTSPRGRPGRAGGRCPTKPHDRATSRLRSGGSDRLRT